MNKQNKKALLLPEEILKLVIAVLVILLLFYLAYSLYNIFTITSESEQAKSVLNTIETQANSLAAGEEDKILLVNPKAWYLIYYNKGEFGLSKCQDKNCLCMCNTKDSWENGLEQEMKETGNEASADVYLNYFLNEGKEACRKENICFATDLQIELSNSVVYDAGSSRIEKQVNWIDFFSLPKNLYLENKEGRIRISLKSESSGEIMKNLLKMAVNYQPYNGWSVEKYVQEKANNCKFVDGKFPVLADYYGQPASQLMFLIFEYYSESQLKRDYGDGMLALEFITKETGKISQVSIGAWGCCITGMCKCKKIQEEKLVCDNDFKSYLRFYIPE